MKKGSRRKGGKKAKPKVPEQGDLLADVTSGEVEAAVASRSDVGEVVKEEATGAGGSSGEKSEDLAAAEPERAVAEDSETKTTAEAPMEAASDEADEPTAKGGEPSRRESVEEDAAKTSEKPSGKKARDHGPTPPAETYRRAVVFELVGDDAPDAPVAPPAGERLARAKELVQAGRVEDAVDLYRAILLDNPASLKARNNLGALYDALGRHSLALEQFEAAAKIDPENVEVLVNLGSTLGALGRYEDGELELRRALRLEPENVEVHASLGILHFRRGLYAQAELDLRWVCEQNPDHGQAFFYRGEALNRLGRVDESLEALERATVLQPNNVKAYYTMGLLYDRKHLTAEAAAMYRRVRELQKG